MEDIEIQQSQQTPGTPLSTENEERENTTFHTDPDGEKFIEFLESVKAQIQKYDKSGGLKPSQLKYMFDLAHRDLWEALTSMYNAGFAHGYKQGNLDHAAFIRTMKSTGKQN